MKYIAIIQDVMVKSMWVCLIIFCIADKVYTNSFYRSGLFFIFIVQQIEKGVYVCIKICICETLISQ